jgi:hypothetical protein
MKKICAKIIPPSLCSKQNMKKEISSGISQDNRKNLTSEKNNATLGMRLDSCITTQKQNIKSFVPQSFSAYIKKGQIVVQASRFCIMTICLALQHFQ